MSNQPADNPQPSGSFLTSAHFTAIDTNRPIYDQIREIVENLILDGILAEDSQVPSTNEFAVFYRINPATARKGINILVDEHLLYKQRGMGMFVRPGARELVAAKHRRQFLDNYVRPLRAEASRLNLTENDLLKFITQPLDDSGPRR